MTQIWLENDDNKTHRLLSEKRAQPTRAGRRRKLDRFYLNRKDNHNDLCVRCKWRREKALTQSEEQCNRLRIGGPTASEWLATITDPKTDEEEKNDKAKNDFRWVDENVKMSRLYLVPLKKDASGKREPRKLTTENYNVENLAGRLTGPE